MIPITDRRGRIIAFGGRALGESPAKYLNSPDTDLFHKGRVLYNLAGARQAMSAKSGSGEARLVVVEGYMDVIALADNGFPGAVAPLGTAVTEEQIQELWKLSDEPILCLDGDNAGLRAALRAAERALPLLRPGRALRFAFLPKGEDPDSLVRGAGAQALAAILEGSESLFEALWRVRQADFDLSDPNQKARFTSEFRRTLETIKDPDVKQAYTDALFERLRNRPRTGGRGRGGWSPSRREEPARRVLDITGRMASDIAANARGYKSAVDANLRRRQEMLLLSVAINHPGLLDEIAERLASLAFASADLERLKSALLDAFAEEPGLDREGLQCHLSDEGYSGLLEALTDRSLYVHGRFAQPDAAQAEARLGWEDVFAHLRRQQTAREIEQARRDLAEDMTDEKLARLALAEGDGGRK
jgi:DNA primase